MKPHPRTRKAVKWGGAVATVLLVGIWVGSAWKYASYFGQSWGIGVNAGTMFVVSREPGIGFPTAGCYHGVADIHWNWWYEGPSTVEQGIHLIPIWWFVLIGLALTHVAWRLDAIRRRRSQLNHCLACNYDRTGLPPTAVCPECGAAA